jgi:hypothetical protein
VFRIGLTQVGERRFCSASIVRATSPSLRIGQHTSPLRQPCSLALRLPCLNAALPCLSSTGCLPRCPGSHFPGLVDSERLRPGRPGWARMAACTRMRPTYSHYRLRMTQLRSNRPRLPESSNPGALDVRKELPANPGCCSSGPLCSGLQAPTTGLDWQRRLNKGSPCQSLPQTLDSTKQKRIDSIYYIIRYWFKSNFSELH